MQLIKLVNGSPVIEFDELRAAIEKRTRRSLHSFHPRRKNHFANWCKKKGYVGLDSEGKGAGSSAIWFSEYQNAADGEAKCPPLQDFIQVWRTFAKVNGLGESKELVFSAIHAEIIAHDGKEPAAHQSILQHIQKALDDRPELKDQAPALIRQYANHLATSYELKWTSKVFDVIYELIGDYRNVTVKVNH